MEIPVIVGAARTPIGSFQGSLASLSAPELGAYAMKEALVRSKLTLSEVNEVLMGCVLSSGIGQAPARQAALKAGLMNTVPCTTINKVCGSGLKTVMLAANAIKAEESKVIVAGGMESMSNVPYILDKARDGYRMGHAQLIDSMIKDGLWDPYNNFHMGNAAELCCSTYHITRAEQDEFAKMSYQRALKAIDDTIFAEETVNVTVPQKKGDPLIVDTDEEPGRGNIEKLKTLKPAFQKDGTITAGNASSINDGASAVVVTSLSYAQKHNLPILAKIVGYAQSAQEPEWFTTAPYKSIEKVLLDNNLTIKDIDLFEINEAFSAVALVNQKKLEIPFEKLNIYGGAVALGHPIGCSGNRILVTLLYALKRTHKKRGIASLCIGGGEAVAMIVERL